MYLEPGPYEGGNVRRTTWRGVCVLAVLVVAACGDSAGPGLQTDQSGQPAASVLAPPTSPLTTVVEDGSKWAVLPAGVAVARAQPPAGFSAGREFLMFGSDETGEGAVRFVQKLMRGSGPQTRDIIDVHSFRVNDLVTAAVQRPAAGYRATEIQGVPAIVRSGELGTPIAMAWLQGSVAIEVYAVGDDITEPEVRAAAETVRIAALPAALRLEVTT